MEQNSNRPNVILIMGDDIGFSDIGCYGGEVHTPHLDYLGNNGIRFKTFYNMAKCSPSRSTLLTGLYKGGKGAMHLANLFNSLDYDTYHSGKQHFDKWVPGYCRAKNVFDKSFYFTAGTEYFLPPSGKFERPYFLNGKKLKPSQIYHKQKPMYQTDFITDYAIRWMEKSLKSNNKFFLYLPYYAAHYPLQARQEDILKYIDVYKSGWDSLREDRYSRLKKMGMLPEGTLLSKAENDRNRFRRPTNKEYRTHADWDSVSDDKKDSLALEMAVYAAMIDRMDQNIGRIISVLKRNKQLENSIIVFLSDNGASPFFTNKITDKPPGGNDSYWSLRTSWANLANTPFRQFKQMGYEGGAHSPFIFYWPEKIKMARKSDLIGHIVDIFPTFLDILNLDYPKQIKGFATLGLHGKSFYPEILGSKSENSKFYLSGLPKFRMLREGDYKIMKINNKRWELYNIKNDPSETKNIAKICPKILKTYKELFKQRYSEIYK